MKTFIFGIIVTLVVIAAMVYIVGHFGYMDLRADQKPSSAETSVAMGAMDASTGRHAPAIKNPAQPSEENLLAGLALYQMHCAECHGNPENPESAMGTSEYPPAPQFMSEAADMPQHQNFYIIKHGIRMTAMPGWGKIMNDDQIWELVTFLAQMEKLPPPVEQKWKGSVASNQ